MKKPIPFLVLFLNITLCSCSISFVSSSGAISNSLTTSSSTPATTSNDTVSTTSEETSSSAGNTSSATSSSTEASTSYAPGTYDHYYKVTGDTTTATFNHKAMNNTQYVDALTSSGSPKVLVLPIEISGYTFSAQTLTDINAALNGNGKSDTGYWESLSSFYKKSSFGAFAPSYTIAPKYVSGLTPSGLMALETSTLSASSAIVRKAFDNYKSVTGDSGSQFDQDSDGMIDSIIMLYSCPDASKSATIAKLDSNYDVFWAYCYWDYDKYGTGTASQPIPMSYFWASYDFLYEGAQSPAVDAHTLIHESGHLMGLDDYYSYDTVTYQGQKVTPAPMGGVAMMDMNVTDHDAFSKLSLNWVKPYVVTGDSKITINPAESSGDCILIPAKGSTWNGTAFDEYMLLELYTPTGLNQLDSATKYSYDPLGYTAAGVRLTHVDSRIAKYTLDNNGNVTGSTYVADPNAAYSSEDYYGVPESNSVSRRLGAAATGGFNLVTLIQADYPTNTLQYGLNQGDNGNLFTTGDSFTFSAYSKFFAKSSTLDNGKTFGYKISFDSVSATSATITITAQ
jgi:M6 family metalloprotease-like protein